MADKSFGVKDINLIGASGTPTIDSPNNLNINAINVAISTDITVGNKLSLGTGTSISSPGTNILALGTNNLERIRVGSAGQIGLGGANYGTSGQVLTSGGASGAVSWTTVSGGGGISNVVEDTTPQLGGNLDLNSKDITGTGNVNLTGVITATSLVRSGGTSSQFLKADGSVDSSTYLTSYTETDPVVAAINGIVKSNGTTISAATAGTDYLTDISQDTSPQLGGDLQTNGNSIEFADNNYAIFGAGYDLEIFHNGTNSFLSNFNGDLIIGSYSGEAYSGDDIIIESADDFEVRLNTGINPGSGTTAIYATGGGSVALNHNGSTKFETTASGIDVTGNIAVSGTVDGRDLVTDGNKLDNIASNATAYGDSDVDTHLNRTQQVSQNYVLSWNGSDYAWVAQSGGGGISNVVEDTTPQLGGNLDLNSKDITGNGNVNLTGIVTVTGNVDLTGGVNLTGILTATSFSGSAANLTDTTGASAGTYGDASHVAQIVVDANGKITGISEVGISGGGGGISNVVEDTTPQLGGNLDLNSKDITGTGNLNVSGIITASSFSGVIELSSDTSPQLGGHLQTNGNYIYFADSNYAIFGNNSDFTIQHNGTDTTLRNFTGDLVIGSYGGESSGDDVIIESADDFEVRLNTGINQGSGTTAIYATGGGSVALNHNGSTKFETTDAGVTITGIATATSFVKSGGTSSQYLMADGSVTTSGGGGGGLSDGDYGDISVTNSGQTLTIDNNSVTSAKINTGAVQTSNIGANQVTPAKINLNYAKFVGTGTPDINSSTTYGEVTWINTTPQFSNGTWSATSSHIVVPETGLYLVQVNLYVTSAAVRSNVGLKFAVNDTQQSEIAAHNYIRNSGGHAESSINMSTTLSLSANDQVSIYTARLANAGAVSLNGTNSTIAITQLS